MGILIAFFTGGKWKLYGLIALAFVIGLIGWHSARVSRAVDDAERRVKEKARDKDLERAHEIQDGAEEHDAKMIAMTEKEKEEWLANHPARRR